MKLDSQETTSMEGWIKIQRKLLDWEWSSSPETMALWIHILLRANHEDKEWRGVTIPRGSFVTSVDNLSTSTGLTERQVRTNLNRLLSTSEIDKETTNKYTIISVCKYDDYQLNEELSDKQTTNERQTNDKQTTTTKELENIKEKDITKVISQKKDLPTLQEREKSFYESLIPYVDIYGPEMVRAFYNYWTQVKPNGKKMLWEMQKVFDLKKRLVTWSSREYNKPAPRKNDTKMEMYEESLRKIMRGEKL